MAGLVAGQIIAGRYHVKAALGSGGMGSVYRVWDAERTVYLALKVLHGNLREQPELFDNLSAEAEILAQLQHPHIVRSYGLQRAGDLAFILMDFIDGSTLKERMALAARPFTLAEILEIFHPVCTALHYAHSRGMVHCDVKPANILVDRGGRIFLTDFGLARLSAQISAEDRYGGTPAYMAPEQVRHQALGPQADIYALGVILFELLSGQRPFNGLQPSFSGDTPEKIRWEQVNLPAPSLRSQNVKFPDGLEAIVARCLEKTPARRYANAVDLLNDLKRLPVDLEAPKAPARSQPVSTPRVTPAPTAQAAPAAKSAEPFPIRPVLRRSALPVYIILALVMVSMIALLLIQPGIDQGVPIPTPDLQVLSVPWLERKAPEREVSRPQPGQTYAYTVQLAAPERLRWGFSWCAGSQSQLDDNLVSMDFRFIDQNKQIISLAQFTPYNYREGALFCRSFHRYVAADWANGQYQLATDVIFLRPINDGQDTYPAGTISYRYSIQIGIATAP